MDGGAQGQSSQQDGGFNLDTTLGIILPMLGLAAGIARPETAQGFNALAYNERQGAHQRGMAAERAAALEREALGQSATAAQLQGFGWQADPAMGANQQIASAGLQQTMAQNKRQAELEALKQAKLAAGEKTFGDITSVGGTRDGVTEHPSDAASRLYALAPRVTDPQQATEFKAKETSLAQLAARLAESEALGRPFEQTQEYAFNTVPDLTLPSTLGKAPLEEAAGNPFDVGPLTMPEPISLTQVPDNVHAAQREIIATGKGPTKDTAEDFAGRYNLPLKRLPGGREAHRAAVKPPYKPDVQYITDAKGRVTRDIVQADPDTGLPLQGLAPQDLGIIGKPEVPPQPRGFNQGEILASLGYVVAGRPELAFERDRTLTPQQAEVVIDRIRKADQQVDPNLSAGIIRQEQRDIQAEIERLKNDAEYKPTPEKTQRAETMIAQLERTLEILQGKLNFIAEQGMPKSAAGSPPPTTSKKAPQGRTAATPPPTPTVDNARSELQRLMGAGHTKQSAAAAMRAAGWE